MQSFQEMSKEELLQEKEELTAIYQKYAESGLKLDMSRGKPSMEQLDISMGMMDVLNGNTDLKCDEYLPDSVVGAKFYEPTENGYEKQIRSYLDFLDKSAVHGQM